MAGIAAIFDQLRTGSVVALPDDCYQGVAGLAEAGQRLGRWTVHRVPVDDTPGWIERCAVADLIWVADLDTICAAPRKRGAILGVDNTFATPLNQRPLAIGADVSVQSVTKLIGGHSDLLGGVVTVRDANLLAALRQSRELGGATPGTLESFLAVRGIRTLAVRLERAQCNAMTLAERLARHPSVTLTRYPGLGSHLTHEAARRQLKGYGTIISFDMSGDAAAADDVCARLRLIQHATSLGAVESTIERRASVPGQEHLPPTLLRLSVGVVLDTETSDEAFSRCGNIAGPGIYCDALVAGSRQDRESDGLAQFLLRIHPLTDNPQARERVRPLPPTQPRWPSARRRRR